MTKKLLDSLNKEVERGNLRRAYSPDNRLAIYAYTPQCVANDEWTVTQQAARGLVLNANGDIIIQCVPKFFNIDTKHSYTQEELQCKIANDPDLHVIYTEKNDGYMIQVKNDSQYGLIITSKCSFDSQYALFVRDYLEGVELPKDITFICELLHDFPGDEGTIVTRHPKTRLVVWEVLDENGVSILEDYYAGADQLPNKMELTRRFTYDEYVEYMKREDVEGVVIMIPEWNSDINPNFAWRVKHKTPIFFERHRAISDCTRKRALKLFLSDTPFETLDIPDEFLDNMKTWTAEFKAIYDKFYEESAKWAVCTQNLSQKGLWLNTSLALSDRQKAAITAWRLGQHNKLHDICLKHVQEQVKLEEE